MKKNGKKEIRHLADPERRQTMSLDLAFYGRDLARRPIVVRSIKQIEHESRWGRTVCGLKLAVKSTAIAVGAVVAIWGWYLLVNAARWAW